MTRDLEVMRALCEAGYVSTADYVKEKENSMTQKTIKLTLEVDVADLPAKELRECAKLASWEGNKVKASDLPGVDEYSADEIADHIVAHLNDGDQLEMWAGSEMYMRLKDVRLITAEESP